MKKGINLTDRDILLLHDCYKHVQLSLKQIQSQHFPGSAQSGVRARLAKLMQGGYLSSHKTAKRPSTVAPGAERIYRVTNKGRIALINAGYSDVFKTLSRKVNHSLLPHDLLLTDILRALRARFPNHTFLVSDFLTVPKTELKRKPDAIVLDSNHTTPLAVELELTAKSSQRYRRIVLNYLVSNHYEKVLYVTANDSVANAVRTGITSQKAIPGVGLPHTGRFYFVDVKELLNAPESCSISNGESDLSDQLNTKGLA